MSLKRFLKKQIPWSQKTFGLGFKPQGIIEHIHSELKEIKAQPDDLEEWIDVVHLALDGAARCGGGHTPDEIITMLFFKQKKNFNRKWQTPNANGCTHHIEEIS